MLNFRPVNNDRLLQQTQDLSPTGLIKHNDQQYMYADIDDQYIHATFPWLEDKQAVKPDYFDEDTGFMGAHISVIYPEEAVELDQQWLGRYLPFQVQGLFYADIADKRYYALKVASSLLEKIRGHHGLGPALLLKGYWVPAHITIAYRRFAK